MKYSSKHDITLKIDDENKSGCTPFLLSIVNNNIEIVRLLLMYASENYIFLKLNENKIKSSINTTNIEIIKLIKEYKEKGKIDIKYCNNSVLLRKFNEIKKDNKSKIMENELLRVQKENDRLQNELLEMKLNQFKVKLRTLIDKVNPSEIINEDYYEWRIDNFSFIKSKLSPNFSLSNYKWNIEMWIDKEGYINFKLKNIDTFSLPANKCIYAHCVLALRNNKDFSCFKASCSYHKFNEKEPEMNFNNFIDKDNLKKIKTENRTASLIEKDSFVIGVYIRIYKNDINDNDIQPPSYLESISSPQITPQIQNQNTNNSGNPYPIPYPNYTPELSGNNFCNNESPGLQNEPQNLPSYEQREP